MTARARKIPPEPTPRKRKRGTGRLRAVWNGYSWRLRATFPDGRGGEVSAGTYHPDDERKAHRALDRLVRKRRAGEPLGDEGRGRDRYRGLGLVPGTGQRLKDKGVGRTSLKVLESRPKTRGECVDGPRPCPWVSCRHHLYLEVTADGDLRLNFPGLQPWELLDSCSLDVAEWGGGAPDVADDDAPLPLETVAALLNLSRAVTWTTEAQARQRLREGLERWADLQEHLAHLGAEHDAWSGHYPEDSDK